MTPATMIRRQFVVALDARAGTFATDGRSLYEVVSTRGLRKTPDGYVRSGAAREAAVKLLDCSDDLPDSRAAELYAAAWVPVEEAEALDVVEAIVDDGRQ